MATSHKRLQSYGGVSYPANVAAPLKHRRNSITGTPWMLTQQRLARLGSQGAKQDSFRFSHSRAYLFLPPTHPPRREPLPLRSAWNKCCMQSSGTGHRGPPESRSAPRGTQVGEQERNLLNRIILSGRLNDTSLIRWFVIAETLTALGRLRAIIEAMSSSPQHFDHFRRPELLRQSGQWCECSQQFWHRPVVSHCGLSSWGRSEPTYLKWDQGMAGVW